MNASYDWLKEMVPFALSPAELRDLITERCVIVDEMVRLRDDLRDVVVGVVVEAAPHPGSDRLTLTKVDAGTGTLLDVVCGASNVRVGARYPFAASGTVLPGGLKLEKRKIRGVVSNGMLCSARELALGEDADGILELDTVAAPGTPLLEAWPAGDIRLVIDVTPNRPDLLSHYGIAREIAASTGLPLSLARIPRDRTASPNGTTRQGPEALPVRRHGSRAEAASVVVELRDPVGCPRYTGAVIRGVKVGPSPAWLADRLIAVGSRPINNVVDITNYILHELGQPIHAFDLARLGGPAVVIRKAQEGERIRTLDGVERTLESYMTVIADSSRAQAVAGVIGGADSEVDEGTTDIFLEVAHFDPVSVRRTRRALGVSTDASYRFERGSDPALPLVALDRAVQLLGALANGRLDGDVADLCAAEIARRNIALRPSRVARVLGEDVPVAEIRRLLETIGFESTSDGEILHVTVPTWRPDAVAEIDLVEEVARLRGYDTFSSVMRPFRPGTTRDSPLEVMSARMRRMLVSEGLLEARPMPFVAGSDGQHVRVANPISENEAHLRRELLESLARRAEYNLSHMQRTVRLFEIGHAFEPAGGELPREELRAAALVLGDRRPPHWTEPHPPAFDAWDAKALAERIARVIAPPEARVELRTPDGEDGALWEVIIAGENGGIVRRVALDAPIWASPAFGIEITMARVSAERVALPGQTRYGSNKPDRQVARDHSARYRPLPVTPAAEFDLALLVPQQLPASEVERVIWAGAGELLENLVLFDEYRGSPVPEGFRSVAWRLTFRHPERTLRDKEIAGRREKLLRTLEGELGVRQRTT